jgi:hypothetical protein
MYVTAQSSLLSHGFANEFRGVCTGTAALMLGVWRLLM